MAIYRLSKRAAADLDEILQFTTGRWGSEQAALYLRELQECFELLVSRPMLGRRIDHVKLGLRRFECGSHSVFYRATKTGVSISRVLHESMQPFSDRF